MSHTVAIITPAWNAQATIAETVRSVIAQTHADWQLWLVADDNADYEQFLAQAGISELTIKQKAALAV